MLYNLKWIYHEAVVVCGRRPFLTFINCSLVSVRSGEMSTSHFIDVARYKL